MKVTQLAAQLYTCRDILKTPAEIATTLRRLRAVGYHAVQVSGMGPIAEDELLRILDGEGLLCCATHEPGDKILNDPQAVIQRLHKLRCRYTAYPPRPAHRVSLVAMELEPARRMTLAGIRAEGIVALGLPHRVRPRRCGLASLYMMTSVFPKMLF